MIKTIGLYQVKLQPKTRVFAPVVVRGEEDKGVRLMGIWSHHI